MSFSSAVMEALGRAVEGAGSVEKAAADGSTVLAGGAVQGAAHGSEWLTTAGGMLDRTAGAVVGDAASATAGSPGSPDVMDAGGARHVEGRGATAHAGFLGADADGAAGGSTGWGSDLGSGASVAALGAGIGGGGGGAVTAGSGEPTW
jgi:hypothetical protein